jgi:outer membrane protein, heavy metal efflux system
VFILAITIQQASEPSLTIEAAVQETIQHHKRLSAAQKEALAARLSVRSARALANPQIMVAPALGTFNGTTEELLITQPLEINGTRAARTQIAETQVRLAEAGVITERREIVAAVKSAYIVLWRERELLRLAREIRENTQTVHLLAQKQVELGSRPGIDLTQTSVEVTRARQSESSARSHVRQAEAALNRAMGRPVQTVVPGVSLSQSGVSIPTTEIALKNALLSRSEIATETGQREILKHEIALLKAEGRPDVSPQFRSQYVTYKTPRRSDYGFSVAVRIPLDRGGNKAKVAQLATQVLAQEDRLAQARQEIQTQVVQAMARLEGASEVLTAFAESLPQTQKLLKATQVGFEEGKTSLLAVLEAQRTYRTTLTEYAEAQAERALAQIELDRAIGGSL